MYYRCNHKPLLLCNLTVLTNIKLININVNYYTIITFIIMSRERSYYADIFSALHYNELYLINILFKFNTFCLSYLVSLNCIIYVYNIAL